MNRKLPLLLFVIALALWASANEATAQKPPPQEHSRQGVYTLGYQALPAAPSDAGIECGCTRTGPYLNPDGGQSPATNPGGTSPHGVYKLTATGSGLVNLTITRVPTGTVVPSLAGVSATAWGFSPDDDRFVYHYLTGGMHNVYLYNLAAQPARLVWQSSVSTSSARIIFSQNGRFVLYAAPTATMHTYLKVVDAVTGDTVYETEFTFISPPGWPDDEYGAAHWGFSPDSSGRTFVYGYVNSQNSVVWNVVNLATGTLIHSEMILSPLAFWQFSPCGDVIGMVTQPNTSQVEARLIGTAAGNVMPGSDQTFPYAATTLTCTLASHIATVGGTDHVLAENTTDMTCPPSLVLARVTLAPTTVTGGADSVGTVALSGAAPSGGVVVTLTSNNPTAATVPANVTIPSGGTSATFAVHTTSVAIRASFGGVTKTAGLTVLPPALVTLTFDPPDVTGGNSTTGTVTLNGAAPPLGVGVALSSSNPAVAPVPGNVMIVAGAIKASFVAWPNPVAARTPVTISASFGGVTQTARLTILPPAIEALVFDPDSIKGGNRADGTLTLTGEAPRGGMEVDYISSDPTVASVPLSDTVNEGYRLWYMPVETAGVAATTTVTLAASFQGVTKTAILTALPAALDSTFFSLASRCVGSDENGIVNRAIGGHPVTGTLMLDGAAPPGGATVALSSSNPAVASAPAYSTIAAGSFSADFTISTSLVTVSTTLSISATYRGVTQVITLTLTPIPIPYTVTVLGTLGDELSVAYAINNLGQVVGFANAISATSHAFLWQNGVMTDLGTLPGFPYSSAADINDAGQVVGRSDNGPDGHAFLWQNGVMIDLGTLGGQSSTASAINDLGQVVGSADTTGGTFHAFLWQTGVITDLGPQTWGASSWAPDINNSGQVIATWMGPNSVPHAFLWQSGVVTTLVGLGNLGSGAPSSINDLGQVVGTSSGAGVLWQDGTVTILASGFGPVVQSQLPDPAQLWLVLG